MIDPLALLRYRNPPVVSSPGLYHHTGRWAHAEGILRPFVRVDRGAETLKGFDALMFHESLHVHEKHALIGVLLLLCPLVWPMWLWFVREREIRADAFALAAVSMNRLGEWTPETGKHGMSEFKAFVWLHPHPTSRFWKWCYGRHPEHRVSRAVERARRLRWLAS